MSDCKTCGAPVNLAPDGDPRYERPYSWLAEYNREKAENARLRELLDKAELRLSSHPIRVESESKDEFLSRVAAWKRLARQTSDAIRKNREAKITDSLGGANAKSK